MCLFPQHLCAESETKSLWEVPNDALPPQQEARETEVVTTPHAQNASAKVARDEVQREAKAWKDHYEKDAQFVLSRTNHHMHLRVKKGNEVIRVPLAACKPKNKSDCVCKHGFPMRKQINRRSKDGRGKLRLICRGNATKFDKNVAGRRN